MDVNNNTTVNEKNDKNKNYFTIFDFFDFPYANVCKTSKNERHNL